MKKSIQLPLQTGDLIVGFMVWVILSSLLPYILQDIAIPPDRVALVTAVPVILGSVLRVPLGYLTNRLGARTVFLASFACLLLPVWLISEATTYEALITGGVFLGIGGSVFSVGVTSLPKYYPRERHGFVNGVYGFGNMGTALTTWLAPLAAAAWDWRVAVKLYLVLLVAAIAVNLVLGDRTEPRVKTPIVAQVKAVWRDGRLWALSLFYFVTFGAFVALTVYLPNFLATHYGLDGVTAGLFTSAFIVAAAAVRVLGGWLADRLALPAAPGGRVRRACGGRRGAGAGTRLARVPGGHLSDQRGMRHRQRRGVQAGAHVLPGTGRPGERPGVHVGRRRLLPPARAVREHGRLRLEHAGAGPVRGVLHRMPGRGDLDGEEGTGAGELGAHAAPPCGRLTRTA